MNEPDSAVFRWSTYTGFGDLSRPIWALIATLSLLFFSIVTRSPLARFVIRWTAFNDEALPPDVEDMVEETMNETARQMVD